MIPAGLECRSPGMSSVWSLIMTYMKNSDDAAMAASGLRDLTPLLKPRSVAIVGATPDSRRVGGRPLSFLRRFGFPGPIYPVNPKYEEIEGIRCYPSVTKLPESADMAIIAVPASRVIEAVRECQVAGIPSMTIYTSGFAEMGGAGERLEAELKSIAEAEGTLVCGPNCQGVANLHDRMVANFSSTLSRDDITAGPIGFVSQSGLFAGIVAAECHQRGLGLGYLNSTGNECIVDFADMIAHMASDSRIRVVAGYLEGIRDGHKLRAALAIARKNQTPVIILKVGRSDESARAAASHTGSMTGSYEVYRAAFHQWGVIEANDVTELFDLIELFSLSPPASKGPRVGILTNSGGIGVFCADKVNELGLELPSLNPETSARILEKLPAFGSAQNPVDFTLQALSDAEAIGWHLKHMVSDPNVDVVLAFFGVQMLNVDALCAEIIKANKVNEKPIVVGWMLGDPSLPGQLRAEGIPCFNDPLRALKAIRALVAGPISMREEVLPSDVDSAVAMVAQAVHSGKFQLGEYDSKQVLSMLGIDVTRGRVVANSQHAVAAAEEVGYPVALKVESPDIGHKSEAGGVRLGLTTSTAVRSGFEEIQNSIRIFDPNALIDGIGVYEMVTDAIELIVGIKQDPVFGPVILLGSGGIMVEMLKDSVVRVAPVTKSDAHTMITELKIFPLLGGERSYLKSDIDAVADILARLSNFSLATDLISELDINPLMVLPEGNGACAADALIVLQVEQEKVTTN